MDSNARWILMFGWDVDETRSDVAAGYDLSFDVDV
jgi:hypothetical protein